MTTVLLTRPHAASEKLAQKLKHYGFDSVIEPLLQIRPLEGLKPDTASVQAVMITSAHAPESCEDALDALFHLPCFCVGAKTAERARAAGFQDVRHADGDGTDLARFIGGALKDKTSPLLYIAAQDVDGKAQTELERLGYKLIVWRAYAARQVTGFTPQTAALIEQRKLDTVMVFSVRTAEVLKALLQQAGLEACCDSLSAIGLSGAVAQALQPLRWRALASASAPTEEAMIECLKRLHPVT